MCWICASRSDLVKHIGICKALPIFIIVNRYIKVYSKGTHFLKKDYDYDLKKAKS